MEKRNIIGVLAGILILLLFLPSVPSTPSAQLEMVFFITALGAVIIELWMLAPSIVAMVKRLSQFRVFRPLAHPFVKFLTKKIVFYLVVAFIAVTLVFLLPRLMPGNPIDLMISHSPTSPIAGGTHTGSTTTLESMRRAMMAHFGLDKPLFEQYLNFWGQLLHGDLGTSFSEYPQSVVELIIWRVPFTLSLVIPVLLITFFLGNWIGCRSAFMKGKKNDFVYFLSVVSSQMPFFWLAMIAISVFAVTLHILPYGGWISKELLPGLNIRTFLDVASHYVLPFLVLLVVSIGGWAIGMRSMTLYEMDSDYILYADRLGFRRSKLRSYIQRNAILPQFTSLNLMFNSLIGETLVLENVFGWPGIGLLSYKAVFALDFPLVMGCFMVTMIVVIFGNFLIDIAYGFIDPRIRTGYMG